MRIPCGTRSLLALSALAAALAVPTPASSQSRYDHAVDIGIVDSLWSPTLGEHRPYLVYAPPSYTDTTLSPQRYPVIYLLDGDAHFHSVSGLVQILGTGVNGTFVLPEMIVVAIPNTDRIRDLTPTHDTTGFDGSPTPGFRSSGGNPQFFRFLREELIPQIEEDYRAAGYRLLIGHSFGGITVINALYSIPESFSSYVAIDPSLWWDDEVLLRRARDYFSSGDLGGKSLYVSQANTIQADDTVPNRHFSAISRFNEVVKAYDRTGIRYGFRYYADDDHGSAPLISEYDALRFAFDGYRVPLQRVMEEPSFLPEHFESVSNRLGHAFGPSEGMLRLLGQFTLQSDTTAAQAFAEMRVEQFPTSYTAHEFLGDVLAAQGDTAGARGHFQRALELKPGEPALLEKLEANKPAGDDSTQRERSASRSRGRVYISSSPSGPIGHSSRGRSQ
ncbi:MAG: alpha/beta hydrolase-fold protein [Gemmatimonadota bacterium]|nr:alpha/beta hydrolase-fold protein [Gemmatimonadota bacterium]